MTFDISQLIDVRQTPEYAHYMQALGWQRTDNQLSRKLQCNFFYKKLPLLPLFVSKILRYSRFLNNNEVQQLLEGKLVLPVKQEPGNIEKQSNDQIYFKVLPATKWTVISTKTLRIDLSLSEQEILSRMKSKTRYNLKLAQKNRINIRRITGDKVSDEELKQFYALWVVNPPHDRFFKPKYKELEAMVKSFGNKCWLQFVYEPDKVSSSHFSPPSLREGIPMYSSGGRVKDSRLTHIDNSQALSDEYIQPAMSPLQREKVIAVLLIISSPNMAFYWHNASNKKGKELFAPTLNVWEAIKESKRKGLKVFDFESVWDERFPNWVKGWKGFTRFKEGFVKL